VGVDFVLKGRVQTNVAWNKSSTFSLSTSNFDVSENSTNEITASVTWQKTGLRIPFFGGKRLNNRLSFTLSLARSTTLDQRYQLRAALRNAADRYPEFRPEEALAGDLVQRISSYTRTTVSPQIAYVFSNRVSANFVLKYEDFAGDTRRPSSQNVTGTFNVRVNISG
jgi:cell surface protein SprA